MKTQSILIFSIFLVGCATGSAVVVGETRSPIENWDSVEITNVMPENANLIAMVKASSDKGITQQQGLNYAIAELKKQAAKVGANAVVIGDTSEEGDTILIPAYYGSNIGMQVYTIEKQVVEGTAVFVER